MEKAKVIFYKNKRECSKHIETWGYNTNPNGSAVGFSSLFIDKSISKKTINTLVEILNREKKLIDIKFRAGAISADRLEKEAKELNMVESTIHNHIEKFS